MTIEQWGAIGEIVGGQRMLDRLIRLRGVKDWLQENEPDWRPEFAALVAERIAAGESTDVADAD